MIERGGVTDSFPSELARDNFSDNDLRTLILMLKPMLKPNAVVDKDGDALPSAKLRVQLYRTVKQLTRRRLFASLMNQFGNFLKLGGGTTAAAACGYMIFKASVATVAGTAIASGAVIPLTAAAAGLMVAAPGVLALQHSGESTEAAKKRRLKEIQTRGYKAFTAYAKHLEEKEKYVAAKANHPPSRWNSSVGRGKLRKACNKSLKNGGKADPGAIKTMRKEWRKQKRSLRGHNGLAIHLVNPVTGAMRSTAEAVCTASKTYQASPDK